MSLLLKQIQKMDKKSEEFFEIYQAVSDKYWDIDNPDTTMQARQIMQRAADSADDWLVEMMVIMGNHCVSIIENSDGAYSGKQVVINEKTGKETSIFYKIYQNPEALDHLQKMLENTVMVKAKEQQDNNG